MLLTIVTLGVFSAWAKVRTKRYFNGNTFLDGGNFDYHASPWAILLARILVLGAIGAVAYWAGENVLKNAAYSTLLAVFLPWAYVRGLAFNARNTSFHGLRFSFRKSYGVMYIIYLPVIVAVLIPAYYFAINYEGDYLLFENYLKEDVFLMLLSVWGGALLLYPLMVLVMHRFRACGHSFGGIPFDFKTPSVWRYYAVLAVFFVAVLVAILVIMLFTYPFLNIVPSFFPPTDQLVFLGFWIAIFTYFSVVVIIPFAFGEISFGFKTPSVWRYYAVLAVFFVAVLVAALVIVLLFYLFAVAVADIPGHTTDVSDVSLFFGFIIFIYFFAIITIFPIMALFFRLFWNNLTFPNGRVQCNFSAFQFALKILTVNFFAIGFSLGLLYPWAKFVGRGI